MISVDEALAHLFSLGTRTETEFVPLENAAGRVLSQDVIAKRTQPPFAASAMDGYAVSSTEAMPAAMFKVIGESAAGHGFDGEVGPGKAVRIFTGAPVPEGTDRVIIQEDVTRQGDLITLNEGLDQKSHIRPAGGDFVEGDSVTAPRMLGAADIALLASMNIATVPVARRPVFALIATGDELVQPGETPAPDQIIASNSFGLRVMLENAGAKVHNLPIARDNIASLTQVFELARGADVIVTIGGASVGDHDIVQDVAQSLGLDLSFYKIAMRPGKPLMAGKMDDAVMVGLPGNPVSSMICGEIFLKPLVGALMGLPARSLPRTTATLAKPIGANGPREHYMRAICGDTGVTVLDNQDSSLLSVLAQANCLVVRPINDPARAKGEQVQIIHL